MTDRVFSAASVGIRGSRVWYILDGTTALAVASYPTHRGAVRVANRLLRTYDRGYIVTEHPWDSFWVAMQRLAVKP